MDIFDMRAGLRIRKLREKAGYSRERLSEMANISAKFLYEIETGSKGMSAHTLFDLAMALGVSCDFILTGKGTEEDVAFMTNLLTGLDYNQRRLVYMILRQSRELALAGKTIH